MQLTQVQRYQIYVLLKAGHIQTEIAHLIKVHKSTISRELRRNRGLRGYRPKQAHQFALNKRKKAWYRIDAFTWILIEGLIRQAWKSNGGSVKSMNLSAIPEMKSTPRSAKRRKLLLFISSCFIQGSTSTS